MHHLPREDAEALYMIWDRNGRKRIDEFLDGLRQFSRDIEEQNREGDWEKVLDEFLGVSK